MKRIVKLLILFLLVFVAIGILWNDIQGLLNKPQFRITNEKCWNEITSVSYSFPEDFYRIECPKFILVTDCFDSQGNKILNLTCEKKSVDCFDFEDNNSFFITFEKSIISLYPRGYFGEDFGKIEGSYWKDWNLSKETYEEEVCEQIEVDKGYIENLPISEDIITDLAILTYFDIGNKENWFSEWLDENCELKNDWGDEEVGSQNSDFLFNKIYKCNDYTVEVRV